MIYAYVALDNSSSLNEAQVAQKVGHPCILKSKASRLKELTASLHLALRELVWSKVSTLAWWYSGLLHCRCYSDSSFRNKHLLMEPSESPAFSVFIERQKKGMLNPSTIVKHWSDFLFGWCYAQPLPLERQTLKSCMQRQNESSQ